MQVYAGLAEGNMQVCIQAASWIHALGPFTMTDCSLSTRTVLLSHTLVLTRCLTPVNRAMGTIDCARSLNL